MTDRIEAIRERYSNAAIAWVREDVAWLLAEVKRLTDGPEVSATTGRPHPAVLKLRETRRQRDEAEAQVQRVTALATKWERLAATAMDPDVREWCTAAAKSVRDALTPVAPDAEPKHIGNRANAEDCPACAGLNLPYPWICPGDSKAAPC